MIFWKQRELADENPVFQSLFAQEQAFCVAKSAGNAPHAYNNWSDWGYPDAGYPDAGYPDWGYVGPRSGRTVGGSSGPSDSSGGGGCFSSETLILTPKGAKAISLLQKGDIVLSFNETTQSLVERRVDKVLTYRPKRVLCLNYEGAQAPVTVTSIHSLLTLSGWKTAAKLNTADNLVVIRDGQLALAKITSVKPMKEKTPVFNLRTEKEKTFVAGGIVAHNYTVLKDVRRIISLAAEKAEQLLATRPMPSMEQSSRLVTSTSQL